MSNSFYYFFSATPQVLAGILALFGVFVIFKIQTIRKQLTGIGQSIIDEVTRLKITHTVILNEKLNTNDILDYLNKAIHRDDIVGLKREIDLIDDQYFIIYWQRFNELYDFLQNLIRRTIIMTILTAFIILVCLCKW